MPQDRIEEQLASLLRAVRGDTENGTPGLAQQMRELQAMLLVIQNEQRQWRESVDARLRALETGRPVMVAPRTAAFVALLITVVSALILVAVMLLNSRVGG